MPITSVSRDVETLTMTVVADFTAPLQRLWEVYVDPRQLERFWGPVEWPATFTRHDVAPGGRSHYTMKGPDGEPNRAMPSMRMTFVFEETPEGSRVTTTTYFNTLEELEQLVEMGMEEGLRSAMSQMDAVLADLSAFAAGDGTVTQVLSDTQVRISRVVRGTVDQVWRAHHEPELVQRWMLGPDGWTMPVCEVATAVGDSYRYEWEPVDGTEGQRFGFEGELLESAPPHRAVTTERMIGMDGPGVRNELTLTPVSGGTLVATVMTFADAAMRDTVLGTGMADVMEIGYQRLEREVLV